MDANNHSMMMDHNGFGYQASFPQHIPMYRAQPIRSHFPLGEQPGVHPVSTAWLIHQNAITDDASSNHSDDERGASEDMALQHVCGYMDDLLFSSFAPESTNSQIFGVVPGPSKPTHNVGSGWPNAHPSEAPHAYLQMYPSQQINGQYHATRPGFAANPVSVASSSVPIASQMNLEGFGSWPYGNVSMDVEQKLINSRSAVPGTTGVDELPAMDVSMKALPSALGAFSRPTDIPVSKIAINRIEHMGLKSDNFSETSLSQTNATTAITMSSSVVTQHSSPIPLQKSVECENEDNSSLLPSTKRQKLSQSSGLGEYTNLLSFVHDCLR
jgi:hypothetical protein